MDYAREAEKLAPYLLKYFRQSQQQIAAPSSSGMIPHDIGGGWHTGTLDNDQAPQFLLADGSRPLTGNLSVSAGVQIDGVDISEHAADPAAHHPPATAGTLISVTGQQISVADGGAYQFIGTGSGTAASWRNVSELAGAGLTASAGVLSLATPGTLSVTSSNSAAGNHTHAIASSSNPGSAASLLSTDANGYLQLRRLGLGMAPTRPLDVSGDAGISGQISAGSGAFSGSVVVNGDLTVGTVLQVNTAGTRVGINRAPDQQFDLDVAGAIRGQYLVGKHAIQLSSAIGVWHFDGPQPYNLDFTGSNASHMGVGGTETGGVIYRPGKFGKAVQIAEATTNYITNSSFETQSTASWTVGNSPTVAYTEDALFGRYALSLATGTQANPYISRTAAPVQLAVGQSWTFSAYVKAGSTSASGRTVQIVLAEDGDSSYRTIKEVTLTREWQRIVVTRTLSKSNVSSLQHYIYFVSPAGSSDVFFVDGIQLEQKSYATPYCDGSLGAGHSWSGTAHASASSRTSAKLLYTLPRQISPFDPITVMCWANMDGTTLRNYGYLWNIANDNYSAYYRSTGLVVGTFNCGAPPAGWFHVCFRTDGLGAVDVFLNGQLVGSASISRTSLSTLAVGSTLAGGYPFNGRIDEFVILDFAADDKLIRAIYESEAPVFVESSVFHWRSPSRVPIWVDEFGLWARGVSGNEIFGLYGGDPRNPTGNVTRSWGGVTMEENDIVIGRAAQAAVHWDDSAGALLIGRSSASNLLLSGGAAQMRDGSTVWGSWSNSGLTIGRVANSTSRIEISSSGDINMISRSSSGDDSTVINLAGDGSAQFTGGVKVISDTIETTSSEPPLTPTTPVISQRISLFDEPGALDWGYYDIYSGPLHYSYPGMEWLRIYVSSQHFIEWYTGSIPVNWHVWDSVIEMPANTIPAHAGTVHRRRLWIKAPEVYVKGDNGVSVDSALSVSQYVSVGQYVKVKEINFTPSSPAAGAEANIYIKGDKLIIQFNEGGTTRYKYLTLTGTGTTWIHTTTAP